MSIDQFRSERLKQINFLEERGINPYPPEIPNRTATNQEIVDNFVNFENQDVAVVGRITSIREHGKRTFFDIQDESGKLQATFTQNTNEGDVADIFKNGYATGDIIGVKGKLIKTRSQEITVDVNNLSMLSKALLPPLEELKDVEVRSRQRYLDLMTNSEVMERFKFRSDMVEFMRQNFRQLGCYEVETPVLDTTYGGANARPFLTHLNALNSPFVMRISDELYLKRLLVGGFGGVFEFSKDFRNEGMDKTHNPEFTQVELYKAYTDYNWMMDMSENLMHDISVNLIGTEIVEFNGKIIDLSTPWKRLSVYEGVQEAYGIDPETISDSKLKKLAESEGIYEKERGHMILELFDKKVSPNLVNPTFVIDYPESTSPLTKKHRSKNGLVERFECVVAGMEVMNCYTELNDPRKQRENFEDELRRKVEGNDQAMPMDDDFVIAMEYGMPPMGGIGISIDRWTMVLTNADHIREVILFPTMKPKAK